MTSQLHARHIRNISIIAHVDHGKTTLTDSLLRQAGLLSHGKTAALDSVNAQSVERGITIQSTGISLLLKRQPEFLLEQPKEESKQTVMVAAPVLSEPVLHLGNLPFDTTVEELATVGAALVGASFDLHAARGFAWATFTTLEAASSALAAVRATPMELRGRAVTVQARGETATIKLRRLCEAAGYTADWSVQDKAGSNQQVTLNVNGQGFFGISATLKGAKEAAAQAALEALDPSGEHRSPSPPEAVVEEVKSDKLLVNLIDSPGHVDFSTEVTAALRMTDGAIVVVDAVEGSACQTETVLRQAIAEGVRPVLMVNKVDRLFLDLACTAKEAVARINACIDQVNGIISKYQDPERDMTVSIEAGTVAIGSGYFGWGFTVHSLARLYQRVRNEEPARFIRTFRKEPASSLGKFGLLPVFALTKACMNNDLATLREQLSALGISLAAEVLERPPRKMLQGVMSAVMPLGDMLVDLIERKLPSPIDAQASRASIVYTGDVTDAAGQAIANCDPNGPLTMFVAKLVAIAKRKEFYAFGRIFSGQVQAGQRVFVIPPGAAADERYPATVQRVVTMMAGSATEVHGPMSCGNLVALVGVDAHLTGSGTVVGDVHTAPLRAMSFAVSPVVQVAISVKGSESMSKLVNAVKAAVKADQGLRERQDAETKELILCGSGELHLEVAVKDLETTTGLSIVVSPPMVAYRETVTAPGAVVLAKSSNKHNRVYASAEPLDPIVVAALEQSAGRNLRATEVADLLRTKCGWSAADAARVWAVGPAHCPTNLLMDMSMGVQRLSAIRDHIEAAFEEVCLHGGIAREPLVGVRFNIMDAMVHHDGAHHGASEVVPAARRCLLAAALSATPRLLEPMFEVTVQVPSDCLGEVMRVLVSRRGQIQDTLSQSGGALLTVSALVPVNAAFGLAGDIRGCTGGKALPACSFSGWQQLPGDPYPAGIVLHAREGGARSGAAAAAGPAAGGATENLTLTVVKGLRARKGLPAAIPFPSDFYDVL